MFIHHGLFIHKSNWCLDCFFLRHVSCNLPPFSFCPYPSSSSGCVCPPTERDQRHQDHGELVGAHHSQWSHHGVQDLHCGLGVHSLHSHSHGPEPWLRDFLGFDSVQSVLIHESGVHERRVHFQCSIFGNYIGKWCVKWFSTFYHYGCAFSPYTFEQ